MKLLLGFYYLKLRLFLEGYCLYYIEAFIKGSTSLVRDPLIPTELISNNSGKVRLLFKEDRKEAKKVFIGFFDCRIDLI